MILDFRFERMNAARFCRQKSGSCAQRTRAIAQIKNQKSKIKNFQ